MYVQSVGTGGRYIARFAAGATAVFTVDSAKTTNTGNMVFSPDNTYDIGASGATRPRTLYLGTSIIMSTSGGSIVMNAGSIHDTSSVRYVIDNTGVSLRFYNPISFATGASPDVFLSRSFETAATLRVGTINTSATAAQSNNGFTALESGNLDVVDTSSFGSESLSEPTFATHVKWAATAPGTFGVNNVGSTTTATVWTLTQTAANLATPIVGNTWYKFTYTQATNSNNDSFSLPNTFASEVVKFPGTGGTFNCYFKTTASPGDFVLTVSPANSATTLTLSAFSLKQVLSGNIFATGTITASGNQTTIGSLVSKYNNITTAGLGVPAIYATYSTTGNTAAVTNAINYTPPATAGRYRLSWVVTCTAATTDSFTVVATWKDASGNARTQNLGGFDPAGTALVAGAITNTIGTGAYYGDAMVAIDNSATAITLSTAGTFTTVTYNLSATLEQLA